MKKNNSEIIFLVVSFLIIIIISLVSSSINKLVFLNRAAANQLNIQVKLQGEYDKIPGANFKTKVVLYSQTGLVKEYSDQSLTHDHQSIFKMTIDTTGLNLSQRYAIFIKPDKYLGKLFCSTTSNSSDCKIPQIIITLGTESLDLTQDPLFAGDISPQDGKVAADDISKIMRQIGQVSSDYLAADINSDGIVQTVDYSLALYSLSKNYIDDLIPSNWTAVTPTPTTGSTPSPTPTSTTGSTPSPTPTSTQSSTPTPKPPKPTATPRPPPVTSDVRPGTTMREIFAEVSRRMCIPAALLYAIQQKESAAFFNFNYPASTIKIYNTYGWWLNGSGNPCTGMGYHAATGIVPADSTGAGTRCTNGNGDSSDGATMGIHQISQWEQDTSRKNTTAILPNNIDRRVLFDDAIIFASITLNRVGNAPANCNDWPDSVIKLAAEKHYGNCSNNYCNDVLKYYKQY